MIIINVLPPEYRRRDIGINPITLSIAGAALVNVIVLLLWAYINLLSIPNAEAVRDQKVVERNAAEKKAKEVDKVEAEIAKQKAVQDTLESLLNKKVYWAKTLNDFVNVISDPNNRLNNGNFKVSVDSISIKEAKSTSSRTKRSSTPAIEGRTFEFEWKVQVVSEDAMQVNANVRTFFQVFEVSDFWIKHKFKDQPDMNYGGHKVQAQKDVDRSVAKFGLTWGRYIPSQKALASVKNVKKKGGAK